MIYIGIRVMNKIPAVTMTCQIVPAAPLISLGANSFAILGQITLKNPPDIP